MGTTKYEWPSDDELVKLVNKLGSQEAAAKALEIPPSTFKARASRRHLTDRFEFKQSVKVDHAAPISREEMLAQRNQELESLLKAKRKEDTHAERSVARLVEAAKMRAPHPVPKVQFKREPSAKHEFALLFSDTHAGEVVNPEEVLGMNEYNWEIMLRRMARIRDSVISYQDHRSFPVKRLHIWMLGDMLSGSVHDELAITNEMPDEEATVQFGYDAAVWLESFLPYFEEVVVGGVPGNHPRKSKKPTAKMAHNNSDWTAYKLIETYHRNTDRIRFEFPKAAFHATTVAERWRVLLMHGDGIRSTMPGVPWGGVVRRITVLEQQFNAAKQPIDYVALGHFHTANTLDGVGVRTFLNGNVKGLDEYSLKTFGSGRAPSQLLLTFHRDQGWTDTSSLDCEDRLPAGAPA